MNQIDEDVKQILGANPQPMTDLAFKMINPATKNEAMPLFKRCLSVNHDAFFLKLTHLAICPDDNHAPLRFLGDLLTEDFFGKGQQYWHVLTVPSQNIIRSNLLTGVRSDNNEENMVVLYEIVTDVANRSMCDVNGEDRTWHELYVFLINCLNTKSDRLHSFVVKTIERASLFVETAIFHKDNKTLQKPLNIALSGFISASDSNLLSFLIDSISKARERGVPEIEGDNDNFPDDCLIRLVRKLGSHTIYTTIRDKIRSEIGNNWARHEAAVIAIGFLASNLTKTMVEEHLKEVMEMLVGSVSDNNSRVRKAGTHAIKKFFLALSSHSEEFKRELLKALPSHLVAPEEEEVEKGLSKNEKKVRKELKKLKMERVNDVTFVTFRRSDNKMYVISKPEVYKNPRDGSYVTFGNAKSQP